MQLRTRDLAEAIGGIVEREAPTGQEPGAVEGAGEDGAVHSFSMGEGAVQPLGPFAHFPLDHPEPAEGPGHGHRLLGLTRLV